MQPIGTYAEKRFIAHRSYLLFDDKIQIKGRKSNGSNYETEIVLKTLRPSKDIFYQTNDLTQATAMLPGLLAFIVVAIFGEKIFQHSAIVFWIALVICFAGIVFGFIKAKKFKFYLYNNESGVPAFDVSELGNARENFEAFSDLIDKQIKELKKN